MHFNHNIHFNQSQSVISQVLIAHIFRYCCPDNIYCAATAADCPFVAKKEKLMRMAAKKQCGPNETSCPAGCCPNANWYCCPDNIYCAATAADCPNSNPTISNSSTKDPDSIYITPTYPSTTSFIPPTGTPMCPDTWIESLEGCFFFHYTGEVFPPRSRVMISSRERLLERRPDPV